MSNMQKNYLEIAAQTTPSKLEGAVDQECAKHIDNLLPEAERILQSGIGLTIETDNNKNTAEALVREIIDFEKKLVKEHKRIKTPFFNLSKAVDQRKKKVQDVFDKGKTLIKNKLTSYNTLQAQAKQKELEEKQRKEKERLDALKAEINRLKNIQANVYARIYGGVMQLRTGNQNVETARTLEELEVIQNDINTQFPPRTAFDVENSAVYDQTLTNCSQFIESRRNEILKGINVDIDHSTKLMMDSHESLEKSKKGLGKEMRSISKEMEQANKGFRKNILFETIDLSKVPVGFLQVNEQAVKQYIIDHREEILQKLKDSPTGRYDIINGLRMSVKVESIVR